MVANEKEGQHRKKCCTFISFCPDSKHLAYQGISRSASFAVIDDNPGADCLRILNETPIFGPDSKHSGFMGLAQDGWVLAIDSQESKWVRRIKLTNMVQIWAKIGASQSQMSKYI